MNTTLKRGLQILGTVAILGTSACVVDPYYSGVDYGGYDAYNYDNSYTSTTRVIGNGSNFALSTGFLVGNYYYYDDYYYPINYYTSGGTRYYRPIFDRPYRVHPDARYRNLNRNQLEQWLEQILTDYQDPIIGVDADTAQLATIGTAASPSPRTRAG